MKTRKFAVALATFASAALLAACGNVSTTNTSAAGSSVGDTFKIGYNLSCQVLFHLMVKQRKRCQPCRERNQCCRWY